MSKLNHKLGEKFVGASIGRPHFGETAKKEKGITLIALIITIIVMLILTGVALSIALGENGIIDKATQAVEQTKIATDKELLISAAIGAMGNDGKVNLSAIVLPEGFTGSNGTYTSENGHTFTVSENGDIVYTGSDDVIQNGDGVQTETVDLNGTYYHISDIGDNTEYYEIVDNKAFRYIAFDSKDNETTTQEIDIWQIDKENKTFEFRFYEDNNNLDVYDSMVCPYMFIEENGNIVNKAFIFAGVLCVQNEKSVKYGGLNGTYYTEDGTKRITFDSVNSTVNGETDYNKTGRWNSNEDINNESYCIFDGYLVIGAYISSERNDYTIVECDGDTYYKQD